MSGRRKGYNYQKVDIDLSILRGPLSLPEEGVLQIVKCIQSGTTEIKETLIFEVDIIYECRVCKGLFRSLTNLLAHKRVYCQEKFKDAKIHFAPSYQESDVVVVQPEAPDETDQKEQERDGEKEGERNGEESRTDESTSNSSSSVFSQMAAGKFEGNSESYKFYTKAVERQQDKDAQRTTAVLTLKRISCNQNAVFQTFEQEKNDEKQNSQHTLIRDKKRRQSSKDSEDEEDIESEDEKTEKYKELNERDESYIDNMDVVTIQPEAASGPLRMNLRQRSGGEVTTPIIVSLSQRADCEVKSKTCLICNMQYSSLKTLHFHMVSCHSEKLTIFPCLYCSQEFTQMLNVTRHLSRVHHKGKDTIEKLRMTIRKKAYSKPLDEIKDMKLLDREEKVVKKKTENVAKKVPPKSHITMHTVRGNEGLENAGQRFKCMHCDKLFNKQESLDRHASFCFTSQATMGQLTGTELPQILHGNMEETMETGSSTDMGRWSTSDLSTEDAKQLSTMINEETLTCLKCDQSYSNISNLHRHAVRHLGRMRFKCRLCQYNAYNRSECKTHLRRVHPGRVFDEEALNNYILDLGDNPQGVRSSSQSPAEEVSDNGRPKSTSGKPNRFLDHLTTLRTRSGLYIKPRFAVKRKAEEDDSVEAKKNSEKRSRMDSNCDENDTDNIAGSSQNEKECDEVFVLHSCDSQNSAESATSEQMSEEQMSEEQMSEVQMSEFPSEQLSEHASENLSENLSENMSESTSLVNECTEEENSTPRGSTSSENLPIPKVPSLIIKKVGISESCVLQRQPSEPPKRDDDEGIMMSQGTSEVSQSTVQAVQGSLSTPHESQSPSTSASTDNIYPSTDGYRCQRRETASPIPSTSISQSMSTSQSTSFKGMVIQQDGHHIETTVPHVTEETFIGPNLPSCSNQLRDASPEIIINENENVSKEIITPDWADVWSSKSDDGEEEFLGFRLVSEAAEGGPCTSAAEPVAEPVAGPSQASFARYRTVHKEDRDTERTVNISGRFMAQNQNDSPQECTAENEEKFQNDEESSEILSNRSNMRNFSSMERSAPTAAKELQSDSGVTQERYDQSPHSSETREVSKLQSQDHKNSGQPKKLENARRSTDIELKYYDDTGETVIKITDSMCEVISSPDTTPRKDAIVANEDTTGIRETMKVTRKNLDFESTKDSNYTKEINTVNDKPESIEVSQDIKGEIEPRKVGELPSDESVVMCKEDPQSVLHDSGRLKMESDALHEENTEVSKIAASSETFDGNIGLHAAKTTYREIEENLSTEARAEKDTENVCREKRDFHKNTEVVNSQSTETTQKMTFSTSTQSQQYDSPTVSVVTTSQVSSASEEKGSVYDYVCETTISQPLTSCDTKDSVKSLEDLDSEKIALLRSDKNEGKIENEAQRTETPNIEDKQRIFINEEDLQKEAQNIAVMTVTSTEKAPIIVISQAEETSDQSEIVSEISPGEKDMKEERCESVREVPQIVVTAEDNTGDQGRENADAVGQIQENVQENSEGILTSGFLIPEIIICPPSVSTCSEASDDLNDRDSKEMRQEVNVENSGRSEEINEEVNVEGSGPGSGGRKCGKSMGK